MANILIGTKFGKLTVESQVGTKEVYVCTCECGGSKTVAGSNLTSKHNSSCGCIRERHGMRYHPAYKSWLHMKQRCTNPKNQDYPNYGGRGLTVHEDFMRSFPVWLKEIGERPNGPRWSIGRKDNNIGYTYGNMQWEDDEQQARNHGLLINNKSGVAGVLYRCRTIAGKEYCTWVAQWSPNLNKKKSKDFSCNKYGHDVAKQMAIDYRNKMIEQLNLEGYGYAESHGKERENISD